MNSDKEFQSDACEATGGAPITMLATAPLGITEDHLGRPYDEHFESFVGNAGKSLFPKGKVRRSPLHHVEHQVVAFDSTRGKAANVGVWTKNFGLGVSADKSRSTRFATYRASQIAEVVEIDDATALSNPPSNAVWYLSRIYYGHSFELVFSGDEKRFHAGVKASLFVTKGQAEKFAGSNGLTMTAVGRGMAPVTGEAIFAQSGEEIARAYETSGDPVPISVEYRSIANACVPRDEPIEWAVPMRYRLTFDTIEIYKGKGKWNLDAKCTVNDRETVLENPSIWDNKRIARSDCQPGDGPRGDDSFCLESLYWATQLEIVEGDILRCGVSGLVDQTALPYSEFSLTTSSASGPIQESFGDGDANAEYRVQYSLRPSDADAPPTPPPPANTAASTPALRSVSDTQMPRTSLLTAP